MLYYKIIKTTLIVALCLFPIIIAIIGFVAFKIHPSLKVLNKKARDVREEALPYLNEYYSFKENINEGKEIDNARYEALQQTLSTYQDKLETCNKEIKNKKDCVQVFIGTFIAAIITASMFLIIA